MTSDSGGAPWVGRQLTSSGFDGDLGATDPNLLAALDDWQDETAFMRAVARARLLVPVIATPTATATAMVVPTLTLPDGQRGFPVFSSQSALSAWDGAARPSPVTSARAAQAAVAERCDVMLLDCGSEHERVLRPSMVWALAQQRDWLPAHTDPFVAEAISRATADEDHVIACVSEGDPAGPGILRLVLTLRVGLNAAEVQALATRIGERIATDGEARARIDDLAFTIRPNQ
jgi:SseB protein N-terminal domain